MNTNSVWKVFSGQVVNRQYYLKSLLGEGGFGAVFLADEVVGNRHIREVAVKMLVSDGSPNQLNELVMAVKMQHPNLLHYITGGECHVMGTDFRYIVAELAETSLEQELKQKKLSDFQLRNLVKDIAEGLAYLHQHSNVHRDLKPGNILRIGSTWKIADFGLVKEISNRTHITNNIIGTPIYMSPEALRGKVNSAWDIWSLGVLILEALTGKFPYQVKKLSPEDLMLDILHKEPNIPALHDPWQKIVKGCLTKDYRYRWNTDRVLQALTPQSSFSFPVKSVLICVLGGLIAGAIASINVFKPAPSTNNKTETITTTIPNSTVVTRCNEETNDIFYRRYPEPDRTAISIYDLDASNKWIDIRKNLTGCSQIPVAKSLRTCNQKTDSIFNYRHPELKGRILDKSDRILAEEWKRIRKRVPGCSQYD